MIQNKYEYIEFPKWLYHKTKDPVLVKDKEEQEKLGKGWHEKPVEKAQEKQDEK